MSGDAISERETDVAGIAEFLEAAPPACYLPSRMSTAGVEGLPVQSAHAVPVGDLSSHHRDPFDRLLVAQAQLDKLILVTADAQLEAYDVDITKV